MIWTPLNRREYSIGAKSARFAVVLPVVPYTRVTIVYFISAVIMRGDK